MKPKYFQISTAIDYPSARFHLGHAYEKICTDAFARWKRLKGYKVHFSTGTDCHGLKIQRAAEKIGKTPLEFVNDVSAQFKELCKVLNISYDDFIMTTEKRHEKTVTSILKELHKNKEIFKGLYEGLYCIDCETFYTEKDLVEGSCPIHKKKLEKLKEESYFFKLSKYQAKIKKEITEGKLIWPDKKEHEIMNRLEEPLKDLSISRKDVSWGIPLPFDKEKTAFVWVDALINYLTTINYPNKEYKKYWPATHFIGPDIVWHHTAIWYSILSALDLEIPKVVVHGFINLEGEKLSKARGITVDPIELANKYSTDSLRYFLLRAIPFGEDGDFSEASLVARHNNELADKLGNLVSRISALAESYGLDKTEPIDSSSTVKAVSNYIENYQFDKALNEIFAFIDKCNELIQENKPWVTRNAKFLYQIANAIKDIAILLSPFIPETSEKIAKTFGFEISFDSIDKPLKVSKIKKADILFKKIEVKEGDMSGKASISNELKPPKSSALRVLGSIHPDNKSILINDKNVNKLSSIEGIMSTNQIKYEDFAKLDLKVGTIKKAEDIEGADKLYKIEVEIGKEKRIILAGIKQHYSKDELKGKQVIVICNLEPRKMRGIESQGMILAAVSEDHSNVVLLSPERKIDSGSKIQ